MKKKKKAAKVKLVPQNWDAAALKPCPSCGRATPGRRQRVNPRWDREGFRIARLGKRMTQAQVGKRVSRGAKAVGSWEINTVPSDKMIGKLERIFKASFLL